MKRNFSTPFHNSFNLFKCYNSFLKIILPSIFSFFNVVYWLCYCSCPIFSPLYSLLPCAPPLPPSFPHVSSCLWVIHISSLACTFPILFFFLLLFNYSCLHFLPIPPPHPSQTHLPPPPPILFLTSPCLFSTYRLCNLFHVPLLSSPLPFPTVNPPCDLHFCGSVPVLVV